MNKKDCNIFSNSCGYVLTSDDLKLPCASAVISEEEKRREEKRREEKRREEKGREEKRREEKKKK